MIAPNQFYRKFKVVIEWWDEVLNHSTTARGTINLGDVANFEECRSNKLDNKIARTVINFNINIPPMIIQMSYVDFDKIFEDYLRNHGILDERSVKKKLTYNGPMTMYFYLDNLAISAVGYPKTFDFQNKAPDVIFDNMLCNIITPMN